MTAVSDGDLFAEPTEDLAKLLASKVYDRPLTVKVREEKNIDTTFEELEGFHIVRAIVVSDVDYSRVVPRDTKSSFGILLDDNNRKPTTPWFCQCDVSGDR